MTPPSAVGVPLFETAVVLPALVPTLVRGALAGVVVYSTLQWGFARRFRKEVAAQDLFIPVNPEVTCRETVAQASLANSLTVHASRGVLRCAHVCADHWVDA